jgi:hypothetical protein
VKLSIQQSDIGSVKEGNISTRIAVFLDFVHRPVF